MISMIKTLLKSVRQYKKPSLITPLFMVMEAFCECLIPFFMARMVNEVQASAEAAMQPILKYGSILLLLAACSLASGVLAGKFAATASCGFASNLRHDLFYKVQKFSFANVDKFSTSSLVTRLTTDVTNVQQSYQMCLRHPRALAVHFRRHHELYNQTRFGVDIPRYYAVFGIDHHSHHAVRDALLPPYF